MLEAHSFLAHATPQHRKGWRAMANTGRRPKVRQPRPSPRLDNFGQCTVTCVAIISTSSSSMRRRVYGKAAVRPDFDAKLQASRVFPPAVSLPDFFNAFHDDEVFAGLCGITPDVFQYVFTKYGGRLAAPPMRTVNRMYQALVYLKQYPVQRAGGGSINGNVGQATGPLYTRIHETIEALAEAMDELDTKQHDSLPPGWFEGVGGSVDGFAVYCRTPKKDNVAKAFISGKYNAACLKFDLIVNHAGVPLWFGGPYLGVRHDSRMWKEHDNPMPVGVQLLGDCGYVGCEGVVAALKRPKGGQLTEDQHLYNRTVQWWRATVEHAIGFIKRFKIIGTRYRGAITSMSGAKRLYNIVKVCVHLSAIHIRLHAKRNFVTSMVKLSEYLSKLQTKGSFKSRYDIARETARRKRLSAAEREAEDMHDDYVPRRSTSSSSTDTTAADRRREARRRHYGSASAGRMEALAATTDSESDEEGRQRRSKRVPRFADRGPVITDDRQEDDSSSEEEGSDEEDDEEDAAPAAASASAAAGAGAGAADGGRRGGPPPKKRLRRGLPSFEEQLRLALARSREEAAAAAAAAS